jgi:aspartate carbamoyltransferase catalytic subunit
MLIFRATRVQGETLEDTVRTMENYADVLVLRHPKVGSAATAAHYARIPVINAGTTPPPPKQISC